MAQRFYALMRWVSRPIDIEVYHESVLVTLYSHLHVTERDQSCDQLAWSENRALCLDGGEDRIFFNKSSKKKKSFMTGKQT